MHTTKGQLSYEYLIVLGMILLLLIPFFYGFFRYLLGGFNNQMNADMVTRVGHATETLANLGGVGSKLLVPARLSRVIENALQNNRISVKTSNGQTFSALGTSLNIKLGSKALVGDGFQNVPLIYTYLDTIVIGREPQIVGLCPEDENPYSSKCSSTIVTAPNEGFRVLGANFASTSQVILSKIQGGEGGCQTFTACTTDTDCDTGQTCENGVCADISPPTTAGEGGLQLTVGTPQTGVGQYGVVVANPGGEKTNCVTMTVQTQQIESCGNNIREGSEECDGTDDAACPGKCKSNCKCPGQEAG